PPPRQGTPRRRRPHRPHPNPPDRPPHRRLPLLRRRTPPPLPPRRNRPPRRLPPLPHRRRQEHRVTARDHPEWAIRCPWCGAPPACRDTTPTARRLTIASHDARRTAHSERPPA